MWIRIGRDIAQKNFWKTESILGRHYNVAYMDRNNILLDGREFDVSQLGSCANLIGSVQSMNIHEDGYVAEVCDGVKFCFVSGAWKKMD